MVKIRVNSALFFLGYFYWISMRLLSLTKLPIEFTFLNNLIRIAPYFAIFCFVLKMFVDLKIHRKILVFILMVLPIVFIAALSSDNVLNLLCVFMAIISLKNVNIAKVILFQVYIMGAVLTMTVAFSYLGIIPNFVFNSFYSGRIRNYLGFNYTTFAPNLFFHITCLLIFLKGQYFRFYHYILVGGINYYLYLQTDTKSAFFFINLLLVSLIIIQQFNLEKFYPTKYYSYIEKYLVGIVAGLSILFSMFYSSENSFLFYLDRIITNRLRLGQQGISTYGISLFGKKITWTTLDESGMIRQDYFFVDSSFVNILLSYGVILLFLLILGYYYLGKKNPYGSIYYFIGFVGIVLHSAWDPQFLDIWYNPLLLMLGVPIAGNSYKVMKGKQ